MIQLLHALTTDSQKQSAGAGQQLRQVIVNTHSPSVVMQVLDDSLVMAESIDVSRGRQSFKALQLRCLDGTWRAKTGTLKPISRGRLLAYLNPVALTGGDGWDGKAREQAVPDPRGPRRVIDREDLKQYRIPFAEIAE